MASVVESSLKFSPSVLARLGEELLPFPNQGVIELVRNAYDADATRCSVAMQQTGRPGGTLTIEDDGDGMTEPAIKSGWLVLGKSSKAEGRLTGPVGKQSGTRASAG